MSANRTRIVWTQTAEKALSRLPKKVRKGILDKADLLLESDDPRRVHKSLAGPLEGYYSLKYSRYRALYTIEEEELANGDRAVLVTIQFVYAGIRKESDRNDVYQLAEKLVHLGIIPLKNKS